MIMKKLRNKEIKKIGKGGARNFSISQFLNFSGTGFGLIEVVVGVSIIAVFLFVVAEVGRFSFRLVDSSGARLQAAFLLEEGIETVRGLRDAGWDVNIEPLLLDTDYWLRFSSEVWLTTSSPQDLIDSRFDRRVKVFAVGRNSNDDIVDSGGTTDLDTKKVTVSVSWSDRGATTTSTVSTYITNLFNN